MALFTWSYVSYLEPGTKTEVSFSVIRCRPVCHFDFFTCKRTHV